MSNEIDKFFASEYGELRRCQFVIVNEIGNIYFELYVRRINESIMNDEEFRYLWILVSDKLLRCKTETKSPCIFVAN